MKSKLMKKIFVLLAGILFCQPMLSMPLASAAWQPEISVLVTSNSSELSLTAVTKAILQDADNKKIVQKLAAWQQIKFTIKDAKLTIAAKDKKIAGNVLELLPMDNNKALQIVKINGRDYRGSVRILVQNGKLKVLNVVPVEEYLRGVLPQEMPSEWNIEALKAQAVAARSFALRNRKRHIKEGYDICATTHCQSYLGKAGERSSTNQAVAVTRGEVLKYNGQLADTLFHTDSGGMTENSENVWGTKIPYLRAAKEVYTNTQPWEKNITLDDLKIVLSKHNQGVGDIRKIKLSPLTVGKSANDRTISGRVSYLEIAGNNGSKKITGNDFRNYLGLRSTLFQVSLRNNVCFISGFGWGHGLGLSQWGAKTLADVKKYDYRAILAHYYQGTELKKLY